MEQCSCYVSGELNLTGSEATLIRLNPSLPVGSQARRLFIETVRRLASTPEMKEVTSVRAAALCAAERYELHRQVLRVCLSVICDLRLQGWSFHITHSDIWGSLPKTNSESAHLEKQRVREAHLFERDSQLRMPATREFVRKMERQHLGPNGWGSIFSLMRDGRELATVLRTSLQSPDPVEGVDLLRRCIDPYIQVVRPEALCQTTGLKLTDVWRYFRHTWVTPYYSIPGRQMWILIRDRAAPNHPVMGIAALGSAVVQLTPRDNWIGWTPKVFIKNLEEHPTSNCARWLSNSLRTLIQGIYRKDFLKERTLNRTDLRSPTSMIVRRLLRESDKARRWHVKYPKARQHKKAEHDWEAQARTYLFRAKRARVLAGLLKAKQNLLDAGFKSPTRRCLSTALKTSAGRHAIEVILKHIKAMHVGIDMLDITVCGAIPPYNGILGGKLVAMLLTSPEVALAYERKYANSHSIIASSMAGKPVIRKPKLVMLGTTSLYGVSSSQYNRIKIPVRDAGGAGDSEISYELLGRSLGYGSYHLSAATVAEIQVMLAQSQNGRRVNSIFGEGVNPRLRKIRDGLTEAGLPSDVLLLHGNPRLIYGIRLATNFREVLLGRAKRPNNAFSKSNPIRISRGIVNFWMKRWLSRRIQREEVLRELECHSVNHPLRHGARVVLPPIEDERPLFAVAGDSAPGPQRVNRSHSSAPARPPRSRPFSRQINH
jgi:hypothetical protein